MSNLRQIKNTIVNDLIIHKADKSNSYLKSEVDQMRYTDALYGLGYNFTKTFFDN